MCSFFKFANIDAGVCVCVLSVFGGVSDFFSGNSRLCKTDAVFATTAIMKNRMKSNNPAGYTNGNSNSLSNGNGHSNGHHKSNGHSNGHTNGNSKISNGTHPNISNGYAEDGEEILHSSSLEQGILPRVRSFLLRKNKEHEKFLLSLQV